MTPTLKQIEESERICEAADIFRMPWVLNFNEPLLLVQAQEADHSVGADGREAIMTLREGIDPEWGPAILAFASHASTMLPATLELVRELYDLIQELSEVFVEYGPDFDVVVRARLEKMEKQ